MGQQTIQDIDYALRQNPYIQQIDSILQNDALATDDKNEQLDSLVSRISQKRNGLLRPKIIEDANGGARMRYGFNYMSDDAPSKINDLHQMEVAMRYADLGNAEREEGFYEKMGAAIMGRMSDDIGPTVASIMHRARQANLSEMKLSGNVVIA